MMRLQFADLAHAPSFLDLDLEALLKLLEDDNLVCSSELIVFQAAMRWLGTKRNRRVDAAERILPLIRWGNMCPVMDRDEVKERLQYLAVQTHASDTKALSRGTCASNMLFDRRPPSPDVDTKEARALPSPPSLALIPTVSNLDLDELDESREIKTPYEPLSLGNPEDVDSFSKASEEATTDSFRSCGGESCQNVDAVNLSCECATNGASCSDESPIFPHGSVLHVQSAEALCTYGVPLGEGSQTASLRSSISGSDVSRRCRTSFNEHAHAFAQLAARITSEKEPTTPGENLEIVSLLNVIWSSNPYCQEITPPQRQYRWGILTQSVVGLPETQVATTVEVERRNLLVGKEYIVGRSRKSDLRIRQNTPIPYISGQHFRLWHEIEWPKVDHLGTPIPEMSVAQVENESARESIGTHTADQSAVIPGATTFFKHPGSSIGSSHEPRLVAWIEDLSQNGTFINGNVLGKGYKHRLRHGDRIELVFSHMSVAPPPLGFDFPVFTYLSPGPTMRNCMTQT